MLILHFMLILTFISTLLAKKNKELSV